MKPNRTIAAWGMLTIALITCCITTLCADDPRPCGYTIGPSKNNRDCSATFQTNTYSCPSYCQSGTDGYDYQSAEFVEAIANTGNKKITKTTPVLCAKYMYCQFFNVRDLQCNHDNNDCEEPTVRADCFQLIAQNDSTQDLMKNDTDGEVCTE